jgi:hypothetical protein
MFIRLSRYAEVRDINLLIILMEHDGDAMRKANGEPAGHGGALLMRAVIATYGVHLLLSDAFLVKETKRCAIKRTKVGAESAEPAVMPLTLVETRVRHQDLTALAQQSLKQETPTTSRRL